jgi:S1-C subfamily serine protease
MNDQEYRAKIAGWVIALALCVVFFVLATITSGRGAPQAPLLAGSTVKVLIKGDDGAEGHGSAVHLGGGRYLTAAHVAEENSELTIVDDRGLVNPASLLWRNADFDIAIIKGPPSPRTAPLACRLVDIGEEVRALGNPGPLDFISLWGRVAGRPAPFPGAWREVVPLDITSGGGMSGGPVLDAAGHVVGVTVGGFKTSPIVKFVAMRGFTFMVPSRVACDLLLKGNA